MPSSHLIVINVHPHNTFLLSFVHSPVYRLMGFPVFSLRVNTDNLIRISQGEGRRLGGGDGRRGRGRVGYSSAEQLRRISAQRSVKD